MAILALSVSLSPATCRKSVSAENAEQILTGRTWTPFKAYAEVDRSVYNYHRGVRVEPDYNLDNESITFYSNGTGSYTGTDGYKYSFTWQFTNANKTKLVWDVNFGAYPTRIYWSIKKLSSTELEYDEEYERDGMNFKGIVSRMPK